MDTSAGTGDTNKHAIVLIVVIVVLVLLASAGLAFFCIMRKRRRKKDQAVTAHLDTDKTGNEGENSQWYFQQKAELDDEQRRHEMEAAEGHYELEGDFEIREMPAEGRERHCGRQELRGEEHSKELDNG